MSIYFVKSVPFSSKVESFEQRGLSSSASAKCTEAGVFPVEKNFFPTLLKYGNAQFEVQAVLEKKQVWYNAATQLMIDGLKGFKYFPFEAPVLCVEMKQEGSVLNALGLYESGTGKQSLYAGTPNIDQMSTLMNLGLDLYTTVPAGNVNISGYLAWVYAWRGINAYFSIGGGKNREYTGMVYLSEATATSISASPATMETVDAKGKKVAARPERSAGGIINMASLNLRAAGTNYGDASHYIVNPDDDLASQGFLFEYFRDMLEADPDGPFLTFMSLFRNCLAEDLQESSEVVTMLRRGFRYLCHSQPGKIIQHIYWGIQASMKLNGDLRLIQDGGRYAGFVILGPGEILVKNKVKKALSEEELQKHVGSLNRHSAAVENICNILDVLERIDGKEQVIDRVKAKKNPRVIREAILAREALTIEEVKGELNVAIGDLRYAQEYWPITQENILRFFLAMAGRHNFENEPFYVSVETMTNRSSEVLPYLAVFGSRAPTVHYGNKVMHVTSLDKEDPNLQVKDGKNVLPYIPYEIQGISAAAGSWASAKRSRSIKFRVSAGVKEGQLCGGKDRAGIVSRPQMEPLYAALRQWMYSEHEVRKEKGKKPIAKRGADNMEELEESAPKKVKKASFF